MGEAHVRASFTIFLIVIIFKVERHFINQSEVILLTGYCREPVIVT